MAPVSVRSGAPKLRLGPSSGFGSMASSSEISDQPFLAQLHQHHIDGQRCRCRSPGKWRSCDATAETLPASSLGHVAHHAQAKRVDAALMQRILRKGLMIAACASKLRLRRIAGLEAERPLLLASWPDASGRCAGEEELGMLGAPTDSFPCARGKSSIGQ
jgi:hypothetical protein